MTKSSAPIQSLAVYCRSTAALEDHGLSRAWRRQIRCHCAFAGPVTLARDLVTWQRTDHLGARE